MLHPLADDLLFGYQLALTDDHLIASGFTHQQFSFSGGSWRPEQMLAPSVYPDRTVLGALAWIGQPGDNGPGVIAGYRLDSPRDPR